MQFLNPARVLYDRANVTTHASTRRGVYAMFTILDECLYVGQTDDIRRRLLEHLDGDDRADQCLRERGASYCLWEETPNSGKRERELYFAYDKPPCNLIEPNVLNT